MDDAPTPTQQAAIDHEKGPALVLAGPGSGKTFILIRRYARLVAAGTQPERILLLTFGRNAAAELRTRLRAQHQIGAVSDGTPTAPDLNYGAFTFHASALGLVRELSNFIALPPHMRTLGGAEKWRLLRDIVRELRPTHLYSPTQPTYELRTIARVISDAKSERVTPGALIEWATRTYEGESPLDALRREKLGEIGRVYAEYMRRGRSDGLFDLDDQILLALELLASEAIRAEVQSRYEYIMVDEYQDTSDAQAELVGAVAGSAVNLMVVADDDQSIYKFRGASRHNVIKFRARYPTCAVYPIAENRRSTPQIVRSSLALMYGRPNREAKDLSPIKPDGTAVNLVFAVDVDSEALAVADRITALQRGGVAYKDVAVLGRKRVHLELIARALRERGIPFHFPGRRDYFKRPVVKAVIALLRAAQEPDDDMLYTRLMELSPYQVGTARFGLLKEARELGVPIRTLVGRARELGLSPVEAERFARLASDVGQLALMKDAESPLEVLQTAYERSRYAGLLDESDELRQLDGYALLRKLTDLIWEYVGETPDASLGQCLDHLSLLEETEEEDDVPEPAVARDAVRLGTIHGAKGLEYPHVFVVELMERELPVRERAESLELPEQLVYRDESLPEDPHEEEERRLFYVAMTRAMSSLTISYARSRGWRTWDPSPFLLPLRNHPDVSEQRAPPARLRPPERAETVPFAVRIDAFNFTMLESFRRCPRQFAFGYYYRLPPGPSAGAVLGRLVHETLYQAAKLRRHGEAIDGARVVSIYDDIWTNTRFDKHRFGSLRSAGREMVRRYAESEAWRTGRFDLVEERFAGLRIGGHMFEGKIDRFDAATASERGVLIDYKTGRPKLLDQLVFDDRLQLIIYREAVRRRADAAEFDLELHYLEDGSVLRVPLTPEQIDKSLYAAGKTSDEIVQAMASRDFPARPSAWACPSCPYRPVCDEGQSALETLNSVLVARAPVSATTMPDDEIPF